MTGTERHILLQRKILSLLSKPKVFRNINYTKEDLGNALGIGSTLLSHILNEEMNTTFRTIINGNRLEYACKLMKDGKCSGYNLDDLSLLCGFSSRITFYRYFKKNYGVSPSEYLENINKQY